MSDGAPASDLPADAAPPARGLGARFAVHVTGVSLANLADGVVQTMLPLVAITLTRSPAQVSLLSAAAWLPWLLFGLVAGVLVDRWDRRRVQLVGMAVRVVLILGLLGLAVTDRLDITVLLAFAFGYGITEVFVDLAGSAIVPALLPKDRLAAGNGRVIAAEQVCNTFVGAPLGGVLLAVGTWAALGVPAALGVAFLFVIGLGLRGNFRAPASGERRGGLGGMREGIAFVARHRVLGPFLLSGSLVNMASTGYFAVFVLWAVGEGSAIGLTAAQFPLVLTALPVGAVLGSFAAPGLVRRFGEARTLMPAWFACAALLAVPVLVPTVPALIAVLALVGFANTVGNVTSQTVRQQVVPAAPLGRVGGAARTLGFGLMPVGAVLAGQVAEHLGLRTALLGATGLALAATCAVALAVRQRHIDAALAATA